MTINDYKDEYKKQEEIERLKQQDIKDNKEIKSEAKTNLSAREKLDLIKEEIDKEKSDRSFREQIKEQVNKLGDKAHQLLDTRESPISPQEAERQRENVKEDMQMNQEKWERQKYILGKIPVDDYSQSAKDFVKKQDEKFLKEQEEKVKEWERELKTIEAREKAWHES